MSTYAIRMESSGLRTRARRPVDRGPAPWLGLAVAASAVIWLALGVALALVA